ncbi:MAG TPA: ROK family transcriptional regulator [Bacillota bacterium]|nr:ROK family transcriptional regulator [Bacillota bacterium]
MQRGTFQLMKSVNKSLVLNKIRTSEPISRAQIAKETNLTPPTVSNIVKELIHEGMVRESTLGESQGGRKPTLLLINHDAFYIAGVDAGPYTIDCILADLSGKMIARTTSEPMAADVTREQFLSLLKKGIRSVLQSVSDPRKVVGIGVAMHGVVDVEGGMSLVAPNLNLQAIPIKDELEAEFGVVVKVENDARAMALGEAWFGDHGAKSSMLAVNLGRGVGAGLVVDGKLYHGAMDIAGEVGHMTIDLNGEQCECGSRGCLQTFATGDAIARRAKAVLKDAANSSDKTDSLGQRSELTGEQVYQLAANGHTQLAEVLRETGTIIGIGLTNLIHAINPELIVLGGGVTKAKDFILPAIRRVIESRGLTTEAKQTPVVVSKLGDDATLLGAVSLLLVELFDPR